MPLRARVDGREVHVWDLTGETAHGGPGSPSGPPALADPGLTLEAALGRLG